jgi:predicted regulator of Ras-like GTPase activity (Roadblock/LC7/MglB family)
MSFESVLQAIVEECPGALGAALMGSDGIPIAQVAAQGVSEHADELTVLGVEFGRILDEARKAGDAAGAGAALELCVRTERFHVVLHALDPETYLVLALAPHGNVGKGRYLMRRHQLSLREEL